MRRHLITRQVQALALRAVAQHALGATADALASLERALALAEPGGLVRAFLDLGPPLVEVLRLVVAGRPGSAYRRALLAAGAAAAPGSPGAAAPAGPPGPAPERLLEPLTAREREVLDRLRRRWLNKEIAADLLVSTETVKTHTANLYAKLGVGDRRQAVRRAAALGLLPPA